MAAGSAAKTTPKLMTLIGVMEPSKPGGVKDGEGPWLLVFNLIACRHEGDQLCKEVIRVEQSMSERRLKAEMNRLKPLAIVRIRGRFRRRKVFGQRVFVATSLTLGARDRELRAIATELRRPVTFEDRDLGTLTLDRQYGWFEGSGNWLGTSIKLYLSAESIETAKARVGEAKCVFRDAKRLDASIRSSIAKKLYKVCQNWSDEAGETVPTRVQFMSRLEFDSITCKPDGGTEFILNDGDLFFGHAIQVSADQRGRIDRVDLFG